MLWAFTGLRTVFCLSKHFLTPLWHGDLKVTVRIEHPAFLPSPVFFPSHVWKRVSAARPKSRTTGVTFAGVGAEGMQLVSWILEGAAVCCLYTHAAAFSSMELLTLTLTHKKSKLLFQSEAHQWRISEEMLDLSLSRWNERLCVQSQSNFSLHVTSLRTDSPCWRIRVREVWWGQSVCGHCLVSRGAGGGGGGDDLMPWGSRTKSWEVELCVPLLLLVSCKISALALHFGKVIRR